jgi:pullulanase/glycogen debranching enzyme
MPTRDRKIAHAWLESPTRGVIELARDWRARHVPPVALAGENAPRFATLTKLPDYVYGESSGYFVNKKGEIFFFVPLAGRPELARDEAALYLAGDFNGWQQAVGNGDWRLRPASLGGDPVLILAAQAERFFSSPLTRFKFVTGEHAWLPVSATAPNAARDDGGNLNYVVEPDRTGQHLYAFTLAAPADLSAGWTVTWQDTDGVPLRPGEFFHQLKSRAPLGSFVQGGETAFRLFAPRARNVELCVCEDLRRQATPHRYALARGADHTWEITLTQNLHGWFYWYHIDGPRDAFGAFDPVRKVLDPYALAAVERLGPGIVLDRAGIAAPDRSFKTPAWQDLVIVEAHVRDLTALAPIKLNANERLGFSGLRQWVESPDFYLHHLGVNAVELQPVQEFDNRTREEYHWGYMTCNFFAPASAYAREPERASGIRELQELVAAFHRRGMAVLLDVVYNHVGEPAHLLAIDKLYYFETAADGTLANWSGCGNDLRARSAMAKRLIIESCAHLIETFGIDGFRFDLADLLELDVLKEIEVALKRVKPDVVLIAEPWSFRGHLGGALRDTGWASWNDGYRNFAREFVRGGGSREAYEYFLKGSPWHYAKWPAQTVNYTESHDDKTWLDVITENPGGNGASPTANDRRRTHLMAAMLFSSIGIPMLSAGQDFLRSKQGVNNTYQRGDLNALDYRRIYRYPATHAYFADWIAFRRSELGRLLRLYTRPADTYFRFIFAAESTAAATLYNADRSLGEQRLLFAINPTLADATLALGPELSAGRWRQLADAERFFGPARHGEVRALEPELYLPALSCGLWVCEE